MKKTILALALAAGLTSFAGSAKAALVFDDDSNLSYQEDLVEDQALRSSYMTTYSKDLNNIQFYQYQAMNYQNMYMQSMNQSMMAMMRMDYGSYMYYQMQGVSYMQQSSYFGNLVGFTQSQLNMDQANLASINADMNVDASEFAAATAAAATAAVPEPSQVAASLLLAAGVAGFVIVKRRQEASELEALAA